MNKQFSSLKKILVLVTILAVPGFLYYLLTEKGKNRYKPLGIYGPKELLGTFHTVRGKEIPDTLYHKVSISGFRNQDNKLVDLASDTSHITVFNFFFTRCKSSCFHMNSEMSLLNKMYRNNKLVKFISITVDPDYDSASVLNEYSKPFGAKPGKWEFLTGNKDTIYTLARTGFLVDAMQDTTKKNTFIHSPKLILLDPDKRIRGYYDSGDKLQVEKLADEIKVQITEELRKIK